MAFPLAIVATVFGIVALIKAQSRLKAIIGMVTAIPLFLFLGMGYLVAVSGGV